MTKSNEILIDKPSQDRIALLHPKIREEVASIVREANIALTGRASVRISQGLRTISEQNALYAQGRTDKTKKIVTNAKGGSSYHNFGLAIDIVLILDGKTASWDDKTDFDGDKVSDWMEVVAIFKKYGYAWGVVLVLAPGVDEQQVTIVQGGAVVAVVQDTGVVTATHNGRIADIRAVAVELVQQFGRHFIFRPPRNSETHGALMRPHGNGRRMA